jgi:hypothetical protein
LVSAHTTDAVSGARLLLMLTQRPLIKSAVVSEVVSEKVVKFRQISNTQPSDIFCDECC